MGRAAGTVVLAHSGPGVERARQLFDADPTVRIVGCGGGWRGARVALTQVAHPAAAVYLVDIGLSTTIAALLARCLRRRIVVDTGDLVFELERSRGTRGRIELAVVWLGERLALALADAVVVRGRRHAWYLSGTAIVAPDLAPPDARAESGVRIRRELGLEGCFVVGLIGTLQRAPALGTVYGWDLVTALAHLPEHVHGLIVGDGDGAPDLLSIARERGVEHRLHLVGRRSGPELWEYVGAMDVALSTQTNNAVGAVRTTGKLPLYLACGCPVIASDVGAAHDLLRPVGWTVRYDGIVDFGYPERLAERVWGWLRDGEDEARRVTARELFERHFDPRSVGDRVRDTVASAG